MAPAQRATAGRSLAGDFLAHPMIQADVKILASALADDFANLASLGANERPTHVLMTGGTGFFGSWTTVAFAAARSLGIPLRLTILSRDPESVLRVSPRLREIDGLSFLSGDVRRFRLPPGITHVLHFATTSADRISAEHEAEMKDVMITGTRNVAEQCAAIGVAKWIFASSGAVYGASGGDHPHEDDASSGALSAYGAAKREAEKLALAATKPESPAVVARGFAFGGPLFPIDGPYALSSFVDQALRSRKIQITGSPLTQRSYLDGRDLAAALWSLLARGTSGEVYNLGSSEAVSMRQLAEAVAAAVSRDGQSRVTIEEAPGASAFAAGIYVPSSEKLESALSIRPQIGFAEMVRRTVEFGRQSFAGN